MSIAEGTYHISKHDFQGLMLPEGEEDVPVYILPVPHDPNPQFRWKLTKCSNGNYHILNEGFDNVYYLAPTSKDENAQLVAKRETFEWRIQPAGAEHLYHIVVPGGPIKGVELAADFSLLRIFPPRAALRPLEVHNKEQAWLLKN